MALRYATAADLPAGLRSQVEAQLGKGKPAPVEVPSKPRKDNAPLMLRALSTVGEVRPLHETPGLWSTPVGLLWAEYRFEPSREWRFDWAVPDSLDHRRVLVAIEVDGGRWAAGGGRHGGDEDRIKLNAAAALGWRVLHFSPQQLRKYPHVCVGAVRAAIAWGGR